MRKRFLLLLVVSVVVVCITIISLLPIFIQAEDVVRVSGRNRPTILAAPLTPSLQCSACEITCREVAETYKKKSKNVKFYGTDIEAAELLDRACERIPSTYVLRQENFAARLKTFADPAHSQFDRQNTEEVQYYSDIDELRYSNSVHRLKRFCETFVDKFYDSHFRRHVFDRTDDFTMRFDMCSLNATKLCADETLKPYIDIEVRKRRRWKRRRNQRKEYEKKVAQEINDQLLMKPAELTEEELGSTVEL